ncbi:MAG: S49 family peptidase [Candidatus Polarisedimenticolaceae bacterium]|nr:S49 family peptidase [Candidatus Polarisedimenticolaceae bacterium]
MFGLGKERDVSGEDKEGWERELLNKVVMSSVTENRRTRRWGIFFKSLTFIYLFTLLAVLVPDKISDVSSASDGTHTALIEINGVIAADAEASADNLITGLRNAFDDAGTKGVILRINSPGGSPVQAGYVNDEINRLKKLHPDIPVYAVVVDICASGGYYIAVAADKIYADKGSIVGSVGVLINSFGFVETLEHLGVERRLMTAGEHKAILDPFSPTSEYDKQHVQGMLDQLHQQFIKVVKDGRGERLADDDRLFSGLFWSGEEGVKLGLVDGLASSSYVAREIIGAENIINFTPKKEPWELFAEQLGAGAVKSFAAMSGFSDLFQYR